MAQNRNIGRRKGQGTTPPHKTNNSIEDLVENEENEYPGADSIRMMISMSNELKEDHKEMFKEELME
jgi:hypothetical protein